MRTPPLETPLPQYTTSRRGTGTTTGSCDETLRNVYGTNPGARPIVARRAQSRHGEAFEAFGEAYANGDCLTVFAGSWFIKPTLGGSPMLRQFKEFAVRPGLIESAVGLVMALATAALIGALVEKIIMPIVGILFGQPNFDGVMIATINNSEIMFGAFLTALVTFVSIAFAVFFFVVKPYQAFQARTATAEEEPAADPEDLVLLREIRDALKR